MLMMMVIRMMMRMVMMRKLIAIIMMIVIMTIMMMLMMMMMTMMIMMKILMTMMRMSKILRQLPTMVLTLSFATSISGLLLVAAIPTGGLEAVVTGTASAVAGKSVPSKQNPDRSASTTADGYIARVPQQKPPAAFGSGTSA